ncbi:MAG: ABC transporter ATP-binding protein [Patescibacteria group bacterium]|nr:ABC transporter ATP-binding protein [Patescibacteria group bacterium]
MPEMPLHPFTPSPEKKRIETFSRDPRLAAKERQHFLEETKNVLKGFFGTDKMPRELLEQTLAIRRDITARAKQETYIEALAPETNDTIFELASDIAHFKTDEELSEEREAELAANLLLYFDAFREAENAHVFRNTLRSTKQEILDETKSGKRSFYSNEDKEKFLQDDFPAEILLPRLKEKYRNAGFSNEEIDELVKLCSIEDLHALPIHEINTIKQTSELFARYLKGERGKFLGLSVALMVPALIRGVAPMLLADAFKGSDVDITHIALYGLAEVASAGSTIKINAWFEKFMQENMSKEGGFNEYMAENFAYLPGSTIKDFGEDAIRRRAGSAQSGYEMLMRSVSYNVLPTVVTLATSIAVLAYKDYRLAIGTAVGASLMLALDKQVQKYGKFWQKREAVEKKSDELSHALSEQMSAHLETVLAGERDELISRLTELMQKTRTAGSEENILRSVQDNIWRFFHALNAVIAAGIAYATGGGSSSFVAALVYSGNFNDGMNTLMSTKRELLKDIRAIMEMELMFNGHAKEEKEREASRIGMDQVQGNDIVLDRISVQYGDRRILDNGSAHIPGGSFCSIQGQSGGGKSTLLKIMSGYYEPQSGHAYFGNRAAQNEGNQEELHPVPIGDIKKSGPDAIYRKIAYLSQFPFIFEGSIRENLLFGIKQDVPDDELRSVLAEVGLAQRFPGLDEKLHGGRGDAGITSGGETSRIGLARTILKLRTEKSRVVYLDEPTASVDVATKKDIADILNTEKQKHPETTFVVISHDGEFLELLDLNQTITSSRGKLMTKKLERPTPPRSLPPAS